MTIKRDWTCLQWEVGRWMFAFLWLDWLFMSMPLNVRGKEEGRLWCVGPLRIGLFPPGD